MSDNDGLPKWVEYAAYIILLLLLAGVVLGLLALIFAGVNSITEFSQ